MDIILPQTEENINEARSLLVSVCSFLINKCSFRY